MVRILAVDGGGIRGIIPATLLAELEARSGQPITSLFDLMVGTSSGAITTLALNVPSDEDPKKPKFSAEQVVDLYKCRCEEIFPLSKRRRFNFLSWLQDEKYDAKGLEHVLKSYMGTSVISQGIVDHMVSSYDLERREAFFFKFFHEYSHKDLQDVLMWEAARSSTAGPTFFEPYKVKVNDEIGYRVLIDGGVFANNPAMCAYSEARRRYADNEFLVVSLGTGRIKVPYRYEEIKDLRLFMWPYRITDIMMNGMNDIVDYQMQQMMNLNENYFRFQAEMGRVRDDWDNAKPEHVNMLQSKAADMVAHYSDELDTLVTLLKGKHVLPPPDTKGKVQPSDK